MTTMSARSVELWDINGPESFKVGYATEDASGVLLVLPDEYSFPRCISREIPRLKRNLDVDRIGPGHPDYFDEVLVDLSRSFAIKERGS